MSFETLQPPTLRTTPELVADEIRSSIIEGSLPPGMRLSEIHVAERLGVSRTPVREAMQRLIQEGLLRAERNRGVFVVELGLEDASDIYLARGAIERTAAGVLLRRDSKEAFAALRVAINELKAAVAGGDWRAVVEADLHFHEVMVDAAVSQRLTKMFRTLVAETRMLIAPRIRNIAPEWQQLIADHRALLDALERGETAQVFALLDAHLSDALTMTAIVVDRRAPA
jgi:DNA-binding GntR family transcriptional regulator